MKRHLVCYMLGLLSLVIILLQLSAAPALADNVAVSLDVPATSISFVGKTSPLAFVTLTEFGAVVGTTVATSSGNFSATLSGIDPGLHTISLSSVDVRGTSSAATTITVSALVHTATIVTVFLAPTLSVAGNYTSGQTAVVSGYSYPLTTIFLKFANNQLASTTTTANGYWQLDLSSLGLSLGPQSVYVFAVTGAGEQSNPSQTTNFVILAGHGLPPPLGALRGPAAAISVPCQLSVICQQPPMIVSPPQQLLPPTPHQLLLPPPHQLLPPTQSRGRQSTLPLLLATGLTVMLGLTLHRLLARHQLARRRKRKG